MARSPHPDRIPDVSADYLTHFDWKLNTSFKRHKALSEGTVLIQTYRVTAMLIFEDKM
jgi:Pyruvate/2-oxoacid:ferredoxin oxidoreductase gamma subunit